MPLLKRAIAGSTLVLAGFASPSLAQSNQNLAPVFRTDGVPTTYICAGSVHLQVTWMSIDANQLISITLPFGRAPQKSRTLLLPLSQSGSGVRYASDLASFHIKGDMAGFKSMETAISDEIRLDSCKLTGLRLQNK
ncbi:MAG: hypothetical protein AAF067_05630 [Pseudomonadota bacterium]